MRIQTIVTGILLLFIYSVQAGNSEAGEKKSQVSPSLYIGLETGQIIEARYQGATYDHLWLGTLIGRGGLKVEREDWLKLLCDLEGRLWYNNWPVSKKSDKKQILDSYYSFYLNQAQGVFSFFKERPARLEIALGMFPYKYNPQVRDLGEYLFRTGTYPVYLINNFDFAMARLTGLRIGFDFTTPRKVSGLNIADIHFDQLVLTERDMQPYHDFSLASVFSVTTLGILDFGAGISFAHLWSVDDSLTTPRNYQNVYITKITNTTFDTSYYTFKGTKLMFRAAIDPFAFFREKDGFVGDLFGREGGKIYGEMAFTGLKNYPADEYNNPTGYSSIKERRPMMVGLTVPCWKLLDVFAVELEYLDCPYPNNFEWVKMEGFPIPSKTIPGSEYDSSAYAKDNYKFAVYCKKSIGDNVAFIFQASRDHQRWECHGGHWLNYDWEEMLVKWNQWAWHFKTEYTF